MKDNKIITFPIITEEESSYLWKRTYLSKLNGEYEINNIKIEINTKNYTPIHFYYLFSPHGMRTYNVVLGSMDIGMMISDENTKYRYPTLVIDEYRGYDKNTNYFVITNGVLSVQMIYTIFLRYFSLPNLEKVKRSLQ